MSIMSIDNLFVWNCLVAIVVFSVVSCDKESMGPGDTDPGDSVARVFTNEVSDVSTTAAVSGGFINDDGGSAVIEKGVCWGTTNNPVIEDTCTSDGNGNDSFTSIISDLTPNTTYYVRAYAINSTGVGYGASRSFKTPFGFDDDDVTITHGFVNGVSPGTGGAFAERTYNVVQADWDGIGGDKLWTGMNLGASTLPLSPRDETETSAGWYFQFDRRQGFSFFGNTITPDDVTWFTSYSANSDWSVDDDPCTIFLGEPWRLPTTDEWDTFYNAPVERGGMGGGTLEDAFNSTLRLHASGLINNSDRTLRVLGSFGYFWGSLQASNSEALAFHTNSSFSSVVQGSKAFGLPVRCIKD